jgi:hypothetical protein
VFTVAGTSLPGGGWSYNVNLGNGSSAQGVEVILPDGSAHGTATMTLGPGQPGFSVSEGRTPGTFVVDLDPKADDPAGGTSVTVESAATTASGAVSVGGLALASTHSAGYYKGWFEDPVGLDLNRVTDTVDWYWNGLHGLERPRLRNLLVVLDGRLEEDLGQLQVHILERQQLRDGQLLCTLHAPDRHVVRLQPE